METITLNTQDLKPWSARIDDHRTIEFYPETMTLVDLNDGLGDPDSRTFAAELQRGVYLVVRADAPNEYEITGELPLSAWNLPTTPIEPTAQLWKDRK